MKKFTTYIIIVALVVLSLVGASVVLYVQSIQKDFVKTITIETGEAEGKLEMVARGLNPGTEKKFTVNVGCVDGMEGDYLVSLDFVETDESPLKQYVDVEITLNGESVYIGKLVDLLAEEAEILSFPTNVGSKKPSKIVFRYSVDKSIGNEAMRKDAIFDVLLTVKRK